MKKRFGTVAAVSLAAGAALAGTTVGVESAMTSVFPKGPYARPVAAATGASVRLARGERESLQVLVTDPDRDLKDVRVRISDLRSTWLHGGGTADFPATNVSCSVVGYSWTTFPADSKYDCSFARCEKTLAEPGYRRVTERAKDSWWPDVLLGFLKGADIARGDVQSFWVRVSCPDGQPAGRYEGALVVSAGAEELARLPFAVRVNAFAVPKTSPLPLAITYSPSAHHQADTAEAKAAAKARSADPEGPVALARRHPVEWADFLADYYITFDSLYTHEELDFDVLRHLRDRGRLGLFNLGYFGYYRNEPGAEGKWRESTLPRLRRNYLRAKELGIADRAYIYGCDEVVPEFFDNVRACVRILKQELPGVPVFTTARDDAYGVGTPLGVMDWFAPILDRYDCARAALSRREGRQVWWYTCCGPVNPWPNVFTQCQPLEARYLMGAATVRMRPDGFLYYQTSLWNAARPITKGPYTDWVSASFMTLNGDGCWTGVGPEGLPLPTIRLENFRDGLEDYAYALALERKLRGNPGWARAEEAKRLLDVPVPVMATVPNFTDDPAVMLAWRDAMADLLEADADAGREAVCTVALQKSALKSASDRTKLASDWRRTGVRRVLVESFNDGKSVHEAELRTMRDFFRKEGFEVAGVVRLGRINLWERTVCCLCDPIVQAVMRGEAERAARVFDRIVIDESTFGECTCAACTAPGRAERTAEIVEEHMLRTARQMNPTVRVERTAK